MPESLVHDKAVVGPATHALVIGVGAYPHLNGGSKTLTSDHEGMGQISSPPVSARAVANWLIKTFNNPAKPLATVSLLLAESSPQPFSYPLAPPHDIPVAEATTANLKDAAQGWFVRGNSNRDNLMLFYFCGHGISQGTETALLMADFGANPLNSLEGAFDFRKFYLGLETCAATEQCFFVDACRASSDSLIAAQGFIGQVLVKPGLRNATWPRRKTSILYATLKGDKAYASPAEPSVYTGALLRALDHFAADDEEGDWRVNTNRLADALDHLVATQMVRKFNLVQVPESNDRSKIYLHHRAGPPDALVYIECVPPDAGSLATLSLSAPGAAPTAIPPLQSPAAEWELQVPSGTYDFTAAFPAGQFKGLTVSRHVRPVYRRVRLELQP
jgi:Caspase domain